MILRVNEMVYPGKDGVPESDYCESFFIYEPETHWLQYETQMLPIAMIGSRKNFAIYVTFRKGQTYKYNKLDFSDWYKEYLATNSIGKAFWKALENGTGEKL